MAQDNTSPDNNLRKRVSPEDDFDRDVINDYLGNVGFSDSIDDAMRDDPALNDDKDCVLSEEPDSEASAELYTLNTQGLELQRASRVNNGGEKLDADTGDASSAKQATSISPVHNKGKADDAVEPTTAGEGKDGGSSVEGEELWDEGNDDPDSNFDWDLPGIGAGMPDDVDEDDLDKLDRHTSFEAPDLVDIEPYPVMGDKDMDDIINIDMSGSDEPVPDQLVSPSIAGTNPGNQATGSATVFNDEGKVVAELDDVSEYYNPTPQPSTPQRPDISSSRLQDGRAQSPDVLPRDELWKKGRDVSDSSRHNAHHLQAKKTHVNDKPSKMLLFGIYDISDPADKEAVTSILMVAAGVAAAVSMVLIFIAFIL